MTKDEEEIIFVKEEEKQCKADPKQQSTTDPVAEAYPWLNEKLSEDSSANPDDVIGTKENLQEAGYYKKDVEKEIHEYPNKKLFVEIKKFQKDQNIKIEGVMKSGGQTEKELVKKITEKRHEKFKESIDKISSESTDDFKKSMAKAKKQFAEMEDDVYPKTRKSTPESNAPMRSPLGSDIFKRKEKTTSQYNIVEDKLENLEEIFQKLETIDLPETLKKTSISAGLKWKKGREERKAKKDFEKALNSMKNKEKNTEEAIENFEILLQEFKKHPSKTKSLKRVVYELKETLAVLRIFISNWWDMTQANTKKADKYFHAKANAQATRRGEFSEKVAETLGTFREAEEATRKLIFEGKEISRILLDSLKDMEANAFGREQSKKNSKTEIKTLLKGLRPRGLNKKY